MKSFKCLICGNSGNYITVHQYSAPDKYEEWVGIPDVIRSWVRCIECGFHFQVRNYEMEKLEKIYERGYREEAFRGEYIDEAFERIANLENSENEARYVWFATQVSHENSQNILDVGSGIGVFPYILKTAGYNVKCVEENQLSLDFIYEKLGLACYRNIESVRDVFDAVSIIHVLEHIENPVKFLRIVKAIVKPNGYLFIEVPDSSEFEYLPKEHDEFNSCHVVFYDISSLYTILNHAGFTVTDMHIEKTKDRDLTRIMCVAVNK